MASNRATRERSERVRTIGSAFGETAEVIANAEARIAATVGEVVAESTRAVGVAAGRAAEELGVGDGVFVGRASDVTARSVEATSDFARDVLESSGSWARAMSDAATQAVADVLEHREHGSAAARPVPSDTPPLAGPS